jgi:hypothetical protein
MSTFKKGKVVMLPTNQKTNGMICKDITGQDKIIAIKTKHLMEHEDYIGHHHLYIISDDEIKEGDWIITNIHNKIEQVLNNQTSLKFYQKRAKKIIATTDTSLYIHQKETVSSPERVFYLPQPSQQFIQKYIEEYNKGNVITDILVEYEIKFDGKEYVDELDAYGYDKFKSILKVNPKDNTITIKKVKDSYTQEEVDRLLDEQASKTTAEMLEKFKGYKSRDEVIEHLKTMHINLYGVGISELEQVDNWIKENL